MAISNYSTGQELSSIDFQSMIGGPLGAIVDAQAQAALSSVDFIKSVGFTPGSENEITGEVNVMFPHSSIISSNRNSHFISCSSQ
jgi:hypothetical protein